MLHPQSAGRPGKSAWPQHRKSLRGHARLLGDFLNTVNHRRCCAKAGALDLTVWYVPPAHR